jgi:5-hydroxyisourate hydrolase-like protein (transthyretin family)
VTLRCRAAGSEVTVVTAADGRFEVPGLLAAGDPFELALADPHLKWPPQYGAGPISAGTFGGRFDPAQDYALAVTTATVITGVIRDSAGRPAAGANVALQIAGQPGRGPGRDLKLPTAIADRDGRFTFSHVSPSLPGEFRLQARAGDDLAVSDAFGLAVEEDTKAPAIALHPGARLDGVLVDASGKPLAGAAVSLQSVKGPTDPFRAVTLTDRQGRYAFACLPAGTYRRAFAQRSSDSMIATRPPIELADGEHKVEGPAR